MCVLHPLCSAQAYPALKPKFHCKHQILTWFVNLNGFTLIDSFFSFPLWIFLFEWTWWAGMMNHPPIPISELAEHTELLKANDNLKLSQEYEVSWTKVQRLKGLLQRYWFLSDYIFIARAPTFRRKKEPFPQGKMSCLWACWQCCWWYSAALILISSIWQCGDGCHFQFPC